MSPLVKAIKRFFYVRAEPAGAMHRVYKTRYQPVEGDKTECGKILTPKWHWVTPLMKKSARCKRCEHASG